MERLAKITMTKSLDICRRSPFADLSPNTSTLPVERNICYTMIPSRLTTSGTYAQVGRTTRQEDESDPTYSKIGPSHESVDPERQQGSQNQQC